MNKAITLTVVLLLGMGVVPASSAVESPGPERPRSPPGAETDGSCGKAIERSAFLNGWELFEAADACAREEVADDAVFLLLAGQVRGLTDMTLLTPVSAADMQVVAELYGAMFYRYGGSGPDELFRDAVRANAIFERLKQWRPEFPESYSPGWRYEAPVEGERYQAMVEHSVESRLAKLQSYRNLIEDDRYYAVHRERQKLLARNNNTVVHGTLDGDRIAELDDVLESIASSIPRFPEPPLPPELRFEAPPNLDAWFEELEAKE